MGSEDVEVSERDTVVKEAHPGLISVGVVGVMVVEGLGVGVEEKGKKIKYEHDGMKYIIL